MAMQDWKSVYSRIFWKNKREGGTPLNEANSNTSDIALKEIDNRILELRDAKFNSEDANGLVKDWNIDVATGIITVTWQNNTTEIYDLNIEKIPVNFEMSQDGIITMTTEDGSEYAADIKSVIPIYSFIGSATINVVTTVGENGEKVFTFSVVDGSIDGTKLNPDYLAEINTSVNNAELSEQKSLEYSLLSKEYAEQSKASAESIGVASLAHTGTVRPDGVTITIDENGVISVISSGGVTAESTSFDNSETVIVKSNNVQGAIVELDTAVNNKSDKGHTHDDRYYTETEMNTKISMISDAYSSTKTYAVGEYCIYNDTLWKCLVACTGKTPTEGTYWTQVSIISELIALRQAISQGGGGMKELDYASAKNLSDIYDHDYTITKDGVLVGGIDNNNNDKPICTIEINRREFIFGVGAVLPIKAGTILRGMSGSRNIGYFIPYKD